MPKAPLDDAFCRLAYCEKGKKRTDYWDTKTTGFVLEVRPNGGKTYYLRYFDQRRRQRQFKIACFGDVTFAQAKREAIRLRSSVVMNGDPAKEREELRAISTYADLAQQHLDHAKATQKAYENTERIVRVHLLPRWGKVHVDEVTQQAVTTWLAEKRGEGLAPATVEKIRVTLGRSFELAMAWEMPGVTRNPTKGIRRPPLNNARDRFLSAAEAKRLHAAVAKSRNKQLRHIVGLLLLTGARVSELLHAQWQHVNLERRLWLIPQSKNGRSRHVPLSQAALDVIARLPRFERCPYLVPNPKTKEPYTDIKHPWMTARREAKLYDLRIHDLRHSAASFMINEGIDLYAVGKVLGHVNHASTRRYSHLANDRLLAAVEAGAKRLNVDWAGA
jgi:site-specific recombinase XerD